MSSGTGLSRAEILEIERGDVSEALLNHYAAWLNRMERWPLGVRELQLQAARSGNRFFG